jgi:hypothetical protein
MGSISRSAIQSPSGNFNRSAGITSNTVARSAGVTRYSGVAGVRHRHIHRGRVVAFGPGYSTYDSYGYADECVVPQRVLTNYGWQVVMVNVCDTSDY